MFKIFCKHKWKIKKAVFKYGYSIPANASRELTSVTDYSSGATAYFAAPYTKITTYYTVQPNHTITLYCKFCSNCRKVLPADAFEAQEYEREQEVFELALNELRK